MTTKKQTKKIGIADGHSMFVTRLSSFIVAQNCTIAFCANDGEKLLAACDQKPLDCLVVHVFLPFLTGFEAIELIRKRDKEVFIIACSCTYQESIAAMLAKFDNVVYCERNAETVCKFVVNEEMRQPAYYEKYTAAWKAKFQSYELFVRQQGVLEEPLTSLELSIMALVARGGTNYGIAEELGKSKRTIDTYIERMVRKLGLSGRAGLALYAHEHGVCKLFCEAGQGDRCAKESSFDGIVNQLNWKDF